MPSKKQIDNNKDTANFNLVLGGYYYDGVPNHEARAGSWWGSEVYNGATRYRLTYLDGSQYTGYYNRYTGLYIRCVSEEKTVTDLTYLQDMTGEIANKIAIFLKNYFIYIL